MTYPNTHLRLYSFCNFYLNSISQGIQTAHVIARMANFYRRRDSAQAKLFWDWAAHGMKNETIIVLNGGMAADVHESYYKFSAILDDRGIPTEVFYEEPRALGVEGSSPAPTCWACVLPATLYDLEKIKGASPADSGLYTVSSAVGASLITRSREEDPELFDFIDFKNRCPLAR